jgi:hypothetical protein
MSDASPEQLLACARKIMDEPDAGWRTLWPVAAANRTRQALEAGIDRFWTGDRSRMVNATQKAQMICLPTYLPDHRLARDAYATWCGLSNACHAHPYELAPTADELQGWIDVVDRLLASSISTCSTL